MTKVRRLAERTASNARRSVLRQVAHVAASAPALARAPLGLPGSPSVPAAVPTEAQLRRWAVAIGVDYQAWCFHHGFVTEAEWHRQRAAAVGGDWEQATVYSVLTPVYNTPVRYLQECVYSIIVQSYPYWELCLVDDASTDEATVAELDRLVALDPRIRLERMAGNGGICAATNKALAMAHGSYVAFVDHDDRLAPDALFHVDGAVSTDPAIDLVYSDRDLIDPRNYRADPTFKPGWAPESLLDGNYLFHLMVYRRSLVERMGGYRSEFEGSQDLDLVLRIAETGPLVRHIPKVLYHWRQHEGSMALLPERKPAIFASGIAAVEAALARRTIEGHVEEIPDIWRGHYRVRLPPPTASREIVVAGIDTYRDDVTAALERTDAEHIVVLGPGVEPVDETTIAELCAWLTVPGVVATTGRVVSPGGWLRHAGLVRHVDGVPRSSWNGYHVSEPGYHAATMAIRNVSLVHPLACAWRTEVLRAVGGVGGVDGSDGSYPSPYAMVDAAVRADIERHRFVYDPLATFTCDAPRFEPETWSVDDTTRFAHERHDFLTIDGHFNLNFDRDEIDTRIALAAPDYPEDF